MNYIGGGQALGKRASCSIRDVCLYPVSEIEWQLSHVRWINRRARIYLTWPYLAKAALHAQNFGLHRWFAA
jgi:hypothetical protein